MGQNHCAAVITGASAGLGAEFALQLAEHRALSLILVARRAERLEALKRRIEADYGYGQAGAPSVVAVPTDLTNPAERELLLTTKLSGFDVELVINNAGFGSVGEFVALPTERELEMIELNVKALVHLTSHFVRIWGGNPELQTRRRSVVNIASTAAFQPLPYMATYAATKAFVVSFSYALSLELEDRNIQSLVICPGPTHTEFHIAAGLEQKIDNLPGMGAAEVVRAALAVVGGGTRLKITGRLNFLLASLAKSLPFFISAPIAKRLLTRYVGKPVVEKAR